MQGKIQEAEIPWSEKLILICTKCGQKAEKKSGSLEGNPSEKIKEEIKFYISEQGLKKKVRAATSSCLNICPDNRIAMISITHGESPSLQAITVDPGITLTELKEKIFKEKTP